MYTLFIEQQITNTLFAPSSNCSHQDSIRIYHCGTIHCFVFYLVSRILLTTPNILNKTHDYEHIFNTLTHNPDFYCLREISNLKTLSGEGKTLLTSNFAFSHDVFCPFKEIFLIYVTFTLFSADAFNSEKSKIFQFGTELNHFLC